MSNSPQAKGTGAKDTESKIQFKSANIGRWASRQENPFAAQNRKTAAKRQKQDEQRQKAAPFIVVITSIVVVAVAVCGLVFLIMGLADNKTEIPDDLSLGSAGATEISDAAQQIYQEQLQKFYNQHGSSASGTVDNPSADAVQDAMGAVGDYFAERTEAAKNEKVKADLFVLEMELYNNNNQPEAVLKLGERIDKMEMENYQRSMCYGMSMNAAYSVGDKELGHYYFNLLEALNADSADEEMAE